MFGLDRTLSRIITGVVAVVLLLVVVLTLGWCGERNKARTARLEGRVAAGSSEAAKGAVEALEGQQKASSESQELGRQNATDIGGATNAKDTAGDAGDRAYLAWCRRERLRGNALNSRCDRLLGADPE